MVVDSSVWIEILRQGPAQRACEKALQRQKIHVPSLVLYEVYKKIRSTVSEDVALETIASLSQYEVLDLTREVAVRAGDLSLQYQLSMTDSFVLAHAEYLGDLLVTLDNDFASIPGVLVIRS